VSVIDTTTNTVVATIDVGNSPNGVAFSPDGSTAYVTNRGNDTVSVIDTATKAVVATVDVTGDLFLNAVVVAPAGTTNAGSIYVIGYDITAGEDSVSVIDPVTLTPALLALLGDQNVNSVAVSPTTGDIYVAGFNSNTYENTASVISPTGTVSGPIVLDNHSEGTGIAITADGTYVYVTGPGEGGDVVSIIKTADNSVTTVTTGTGPTGIAIGPL
jgi:YVTN family beta-propeller protein